jgi:hypothetical protein
MPHVCVAHLVYPDHMHPQVKKQDHHLQNYLLLSSPLVTESISQPWKDDSRQGGDDYDF